MTHEQLINDLNVFPVPDGDTGTNSMLTAAAGLPNLDKAKDKTPLDVVLNQLVNDLAMGARGNSGVILAEYVRGLSQVSGTYLDSHLWHQALQRGAAQARQSVMQPREGTMLTLADAVAQTPVSEDLVQYVTDIASASRQALAATTDQLPELKAAGVVDSGALVLSLFHECIASEVTGAEMPELDVEHRHCDLSEVEYKGPTHEVMFTFDGDSAARESLREELLVIGDSVTVTGIQSPFRIHVHVDEPSEAVAEAMRHGRVSGLTIAQLISPREVSPARSGVAMVFACDAPGLRTLVEENGAHFMLSLPNAAPSTLDFIRAIRDCGTGNVALVICTVDSQASAALAAHQLKSENINVQVVSTPTVSIALGALAQFDQSDDLARLCAAFDKQITAMRWATIARAQRNVMTPLGMCHEGDVVGLINDAPREISSVASCEDMLASIVHELLDHGGELVTIVVGELGSHAAVELVRADHPGVDFASYVGGQMGTVYQVGVE